MRDGDAFPPAHQVTARVRTANPDWTAKRVNDVSLLVYPFCPSKP